MYITGKQIVVARKQADICLKMHLVNIKKGFSIYFNNQLWTLPHHEIQIFWLVNYREVIRPPIVFVEKGPNNAQPEQVSLRILKNRAIIQSKSMSDYLTFEGDLLLWSWRYVLNCKWIYSVDFKFDFACCRQHSG